MIKRTFTALTLASLLTASGVALAGSTGPTDPVDTNSPRNSSSSMGQNADGSTPSSNTSTPGTKGMGGNNGTTGSSNPTGGHSDGSMKKGNGMDTTPGAGASGSSESK